MCASVHDVVDSVGVHTDGDEGHAHVALMNCLEDGDEGDVDDDDDDLDDDNEG